MDEGLRGDALVSHGTQVALGDQAQHCPMAARTEADPIRQHLDRDSPPQHPHRHPGRRLRFRIGVVECGVEIGVVQLDPVDIGVGQRPDPSRASGFTVPAMRSPAVVVTRMSR